MSAERSFDEETRIAAVREEQILDTPPESAFDDLVRIAATAFDVPIAAITFVDRDRQWLKARVGIERAELPRHAGLCPLVVATGELLVVPDAAATTDSTTWGAGLANDIRFYAGAPIVAGGQTLGTLSLADRRPRHLTDAQREGLRALARRVVDALETRRLRRMLKRSIDERRLALETTAIAQSMIAHSRDAIALIDLKKHYVGQNDAHRQLLGFGDRELKALTPAALAGEAVESTIADALVRTGSYRGEVPCRTATGRTLDVELTVFPVTNAAGEVIGHGSLTREVIDGKRMEVEIERRTTARIADLQRAYDTLRAELQERQRAEEALRKTHEEQVQSQRLQAIGEVASGITHEFNNLLTIIIGYASSLELSLPPDDDRRDDLNAIADAAERASVLTRQLLAFSRHQAVTPRLVDVNALLEAQRDTLRRLVGANVQLTLDLEPDPGMILCDPTLLEQVVLNLAMNARDAMPESGTFTIESALVAISEQAPPEWSRLRHGLYVLLRIKDTGTGMPPETLARAFEPFFTTKDVGHGMGLGLSTVYGIVQQSGGHIDVKSEPGQGTTFNILLPRIDRLQAQPEVAPAQPTEISGSETILLVEDQPSLRTLAASVLRRAGYIVLEATTGAEAVGVSEQHPAPIHLLVADYVLPGMTSAGVARRLLPSRPDMKVLYMSGYTHDRENLSLGPNADFLAKPFSPAELLTRVRQMLDR